MPERIGFPFVGAAEMAGCIMFDELRSAGVELFADELGHVGYCSARCARSERSLMRWLYPLFGRMFARQTAEISLLIDPAKLHARLDEPFDVEGLATSVPNETFVAAHP